MPRPRFGSPCGGLARTTGLTLLCSALWAAATTKALAPAQFERVIEASGLVPSALAPWIAVAVLALEFTIPVALLWRPFRAIALRSSVGLFSAFAIYSYWRSARGIEAPCGCFPTLFTLSPLGMFAADMCLAGVALALLAQEIRAGAPSEAHHPTRQAQRLLPNGESE